MFANMCMSVLFVSVRMIEKNLFCKQNVNALSSDCWEILYYYEYR